jgi:hypothetical protein
MVSMLPYIAAAWILWAMIDKHMSSKFDGIEAEHV